MFKKIKMTGIVLLAGLTLSGCQLVDTVKERIKENPQSLSADDVAKIYHQEELSKVLSEHLNHLEQASSTIKTTFKHNDHTLVREQKNYETYHEQTLQNYQVEVTTTQGSSQLHEKFIWQDNQYTHQLGNREINQTDRILKQPSVYIYFIKFLVDGKDDWQVEPIQDTNHVSVKREIKDPETIKDLVGTLDLPVVLSSQAQVHMSIDYVLNKDTGAINSGTIHANIDDLDQHYEITEELANAQFNAEASTLQLTADADQNSQDAEAIRQDFAQANDLNTIEIYESQLILQKDADNMTQHYYMHNYLDQINWLTLEADIVDQKPAHFRLIHNNKRYSDDNGQVQVSDTKNFDAYRHFVTRFNKQNKSLDVIQQDSPDYVVFREFFEHDDQSFTDAASLTPMDHFARGENAFFGIDYMVNKKTHRLMTVSIWNGQQGEENIHTMTIYNFSGWNNYNAAPLGQQISDAIWQKANQ